MSAADRPPFFRPLDGLVLALVLAVAGGSMLLAPRAGTARRLAVFVDGRWRRDLGPSAEVRSLKGALGVCRFRFDGSGCVMIDSPCPNKHCLRQGRVTGAGRAVVCLPNRVALVLQGAGGGEGAEAVDGVSR